MKSLLDKGKAALEVEFVRVVSDVEIEGESALWKQSQRLLEQVEHFLFEFHFELIFDQELENGEEDVEQFLVKFLIHIWLEFRNEILYLFQGIAGLFVLYHETVYLGQSLQLLVLRNDVESEDHLKRLLHDELLVPRQQQGIVQPLVEDT